MTFLTGIWFDLKERRLLPVAILLLAALIAVPVLLLKPASEAPEPVVGVEADAAPLPVATTVESTTEGSDLEVFSSKDPFKPVKALGAKKDDGPALSGSGPGSGDPGPGSTGSGSGSGGTGSGSGEAPSGSTGGGTTPPSDPGTGGGDPSPSPSPGPPPAPTTFTYMVDLRLGEGERPRLYRNVQRLTPLPSDRNPQVVFLGVSTDRKEAIFLVDSDLRQDGEGKCQPSRRDCTFLHLKVSDFQDEQLLYDPATDRTYNLKLESINRVPVERAARQSATATRSSAGTPDPRPFHSLLFGDEVE